MARKPRIHAPGSLHHVMLRGNGGQAIFSDDADRRRFCALLAEGVERFGHRIHAYCLMENHAHLAIRVGDAPLSRIVQNLAFRYTRAYNRRAGRVGHLFQGRFRSLLVDRDAYLLELVRYIHLNPVRAGLVSEPASWAWSGHRAYLGKDRIAWLDSEPILRMFDERDVRRARRRYAGFVREGLGETYREELHRGDVDARVWGDEAFVRGILGGSGPPAAAPRLSAIIAAVCAATGLGEPLLRANGRGRRAARARGMVGLLATRMRAATLSRIALHFDRDVATISRQVGRVAMAVRRDPGLGAQVARLQRALEVNKANTQA